jgi:hypothetical protein
LRMHNVPHDAPAGKKVMSFMATPASNIDAGGV